MNFVVPLSISSSSLNKEEFWNAVMVYHNRPHLINRKILAASQILFYKIGIVPKDFQHIRELFTKSAILYEMRHLKPLIKEKVTDKFIQNIVESCYRNLHLSEVSDIEFSEANNGCYISVRILLPKLKHSDVSMEIVFLNKNNNTATFLAVTELDQSPCAPPFPYEIELSNESNLKINLTTFEDADTASAAWIACNLFPKLLKWSKQETNNYVPTLSLISVDNYSVTYNRLKDKYANDIIAKWPEKTTNPQKYVFEDVAIASYLICVWNEHGISDQVNFVDCGCGNGLLVYLLHQEGFKGYGIDIRRRPIWNIYKKEIILQTGVVTPESIFPDATWIIGNHSDELTPWIPVIALKSSPKTNYFVLPCCTYEFSGQKFIREDTSISQYSDYLRYIEIISKKCGFDSKIDKLRIPSTKKICLVGLAADMQETKRADVIKEINSFIEKRSSNKFQPRNNIEQVKNCTKLDRHLINTIIHDIVNLLLDKKQFVQKNNGDPWNKGTTLSISLLCQHLNQENLKKLKNECGGLQTLLRNHRYLFDVQKGNVQLRLPYYYSAVGEKYRSKPCWYFNNHENGCLLTDEECAYRH